MAVYRATKHDKLRLWCDRRSHSSANFLKTVMNDASQESTCDCVSRAKEWLFSVGCFDLPIDEMGAALLTDAEVFEGHESFANGEWMFSSRYILKH
jgi:hypothetical protein